jgi:hypothetical protein
MTAEPPRLKSKDLRQPLGDTLSEGQCQVGESQKLPQQTCRRSVRNDTYETLPAWPPTPPTPSLTLSSGMRAGVLASLAELELELGKERRTALRDARRARGQSIGRPKALDASKAALAHWMHASGESARTIASSLGVSRATVYRVLAQDVGD